ncbi:MAG: META domain-containing protein [Phycisphaerae bacterium]|nr:META domain-containing protein [Phycisphaerae bacterium]
MRNYSRFPCPAMAVVSCAFVAFVVGCVTEPTGNARDPAATPIVQPMSIVGDWKVVSIERGGETILPPEQSARGSQTSPSSTISFAPTVGAAGGRIEIFTGVNRGSGRYNFSPGERDTGAFGVERIVLSHMAGAPEAMAFEASLLLALERGRTVSATADGITIECGDGRIRLARYVAG